MKTSRMQSLVVTIPNEHSHKMLKAPFESFSLSPAGAAAVQPGPYGTAAKQLKEWDLKR
jgi:hypothetical protein